MREVAIGGAGMGKKLRVESEEWGEGGEKRWRWNWSFFSEAAGVRHPSEGMPSGRRGENLVYLSQRLEDVT